MKKCSRCHAENFEDQKFCNLCGRELTARIALDLYGGNPVPAPKPVEPEEQVTPETRAYQHFLKAKDEIARRNLDAAIREFKSALAVAPGDPMIERLLKKTEEARERAMAVPPRTPEPRGARGPRTLAAADERPVLEFESASPKARTLVDEPVATRASRSTMVEGAAIRASSVFDDEAPAARPAPARRPAAGPVSVDPLAEGSRRREPARAPTPAPARPAAPAAAPRVAAAVATRTRGSEERNERAGGRSARTRVPEEPTGRVAPHTGRFLELYDRAPSLSPAMALDGPGGGFQEIAVNLLILGGFLLFGFLLLL